METNENILKISGEVSLAEGLENGKDYLISLEGSVVRKTEKPNEDETKDIIFKVKPITAEVLREKGETTKSIDRKRDSQKFRARIDFYRRENFSEVEEEDFYHSFMGKALANFEELCEFLEKIK